MEQSNLQVHSLYLSPVETPLPPALEIDIIMSMNFISDSVLNFIIKPRNLIIVFYPTPTSWKARKQEKSNFARKTTVRF